MKCPACGKRLYKIEYMDTEYTCGNDECPAMRDYFPPEFYGSQEEINEQWEAMKP